MEVQSAKPKSLMAFGPTANYALVGGNGRASVWASLRVHGDVDTIQISFNQLSERFQS